MRTTSDGKWHAGDPVTRFCTRNFYRQQYRTKCWAGRVFRCHQADGKWVHEECYHDHRTPGTAKRCAEALARRWNRAEAEAQKD
jgi:hypothetical protein